MGECSHSVNKIIKKNRKLLYFLLKLVAKRKSREVPADKSTLV